MSQPLITMQVRYEQDVVSVRQRARQIAGLVGFAMQDQTRWGTAVSEIVRNSFRYAGGAIVRFSLISEPAAALQIQIQDEGPGIQDLKKILQGRYKSETGLGLGLIGAKRLMDEFEIESAPGKGTRVTMSKRLNPGAPPFTREFINQVMNQLGETSAQNPYEEIQRQNQELMAALQELRVRQEEMERLNRELEDTNSGVVALYAELDEKADFLRRVSDLKSRFLSNMSHEFRTPLNSILSLTRLLADGVDGELNNEQARQVQYVRQAAETLLELVNDLLDLAKVEAGKVTMTPKAFQVRDMFGALRGMMRPLLVSESVQLVFEEPEGLPDLFTDEGKVSQILRNLVSNSLKYTEAGEVRVTAEAVDGAVRFAVADTGIGIAQEDQERILEEFEQVESRRQSVSKGTGLGLPLSRKLAELLGGRLWLKSKIGEGSTFYFEIPTILPSIASEEDTTEEVELDSARLPVLVLDDHKETLFIYQKYLEETQFQVIPTRSLERARLWLGRIRPAAIILDVILEGTTSWSFLHDLRSSSKTQDIPVIVISVTTEKNKALGLGAQAFANKPVDPHWLLSTLESCIQGEGNTRVLVIDDDETSRYIIRSHLRGSPYSMVEASSGQEGIRRAIAERPRVIILDLIMPQIDGFEVLKALKEHPLTKNIPVIINSTKVLSAPDREQVQFAAAILPKEHMTRETTLATISQAMGGEKLPHREPAAIDGK